MTYEFLPIQTKRVTFTRTLKQAPASSFSLITTSPPSTAILATCRLINGEAKDVLRATAQRYLEGGPMTGLAPRIEADLHGLMFLSDRDSLIEMVMMFYRLVRKQTRRQPQRSARTSITKDIASSIIARGYDLEAGAATIDVQELDHFVNMAAYALYRQELRIRKVAGQQAAKPNPAGSSQHPQIQIALRKQPEVDVTHFIRMLYNCSLYLDNARLTETVSYVLHLLKDTATSADDQQVIFNLMGNCITNQPWLKTASMGQNSFNENSKEIYDTLWKNSGQN